MTNEEHSVKRLADLAARELAALFRVSVEEAQNYLELADSDPFMQTPVEKVREDLRHRQKVPPTPRPGGCRSGLCC